MVSRQPIEDFWIDRLQGFELLELLFERVESGPRSPASTATGQPQTGHRPLLNIVSQRGQCASLRRNGSPTRSARAEQRGQQHPDAMTDESDDQQREAQAREFPRDPPPSDKGMGDEAIHRNCPAAGKKDVCLLRTASAPGLARKGTSHCRRRPGKTIFAARISEPSTGSAV